MEASHQDINLAEFVSVLIYLSEECGKIIREVESSGDLKTVDKSNMTPVTMADLRVQKTLEVCLRHHYPTLNIQGEESKESIADIAPSVAPESITADVKNLIKKEWLNENQKKRLSFLEGIKASY